MRAILLIAGLLGLVNACHECDEHTVVTVHACGKPQPTTLITSTLEVVATSVDAAATSVNATPVPTRDCSNIVANGRVCKENLLPPQKLERGQCFQRKVSRTLRNLLILAPRPKASKYPRQTQLGCLHQLPPHLRRRHSLRPRAPAFIAPAAEPR